jgi:DnaJ domain/PilZ domain
VELSEKLADMSLKEPVPMATQGTVQRRREGRKKANARVVRLQLKDRMGSPRLVTADLLDISENGISIALLTPLPIGATILVRGNLGENRANVALPAAVKWCTERINGNFHAGLELRMEDPSASGPPSGSREIMEEMDCYEVMQLSPNADADTIARVYRILAQRYHPDSSTGNPELFFRLCEAHRILIDPELRAKYDARHRDAKQLHWEIFDRPELPTRQGGERRKRLAILEALYAKALLNPEQATMSAMDLESLLGCPREHLEAALWYLRNTGCLKRADNGRFSITVAGFDVVEAASEPHEGRSIKLLEAGDPGETIPSSPAA